MVATIAIEREKWYNVGITTVKGFRMTTRERKEIDFICRARTGHSEAFSFWYIGILAAVIAAGYFMP